MSKEPAVQQRRVIPLIDKPVGLEAALATKNFKKCAELYNGKDYGDYDSRIITNYAKFSEGAGNR